MARPANWIPDPPASLGLLLLRLGAGGLLLFGHGWGKLMNYGERAGRFSDPIGLGPELGFALVVFTEVVCSALVMVGLLTRLATIPALIFFGVAAFVHHAADPWPRRELPLLFGVAFLALLLAGAGRFSVDAWWSARRRGVRPIADEVEAARKSAGR
jgi:putative oxidoreductase